MKVTVIGTGYVGLVTGACLAEMGNDVLCLDVDAAQDRACSNGGGIPIHEPGLERARRAQRGAGRLRFTTDIDGARARTARSSSSPSARRPDEDGSADLQLRARGGAQHRPPHDGLQGRRRQDHGAGRHGRQGARRSIARGAAPSAALPTCAFAVVSQPRVPEGRRGGRGLHAARPRSSSAPTTTPTAIAAACATLYAPFTRNHERLLRDGRALGRAHQVRGQRDARDAHLLHERAGATWPSSVGADIEPVRQRHRLRPAHRLPLPLRRRRLRRLVLSQGREGAASARPRSTASSCRCSAPSRRSTSAQKRVLVDKIVARFGDDLDGRDASRSGASPSSRTPTTCARRRAASSSTSCWRAARASRPTIRSPSPKRGELESTWPDARGADRLPARLADRGRCEGADALVIVTEWKAFRSPDFERIKAALKQPVIFDGRNLYDPAAMRAAGFEYFAVGRSLPPADAARA